MDHESRTYRIRKLPSQAGFTLIELLVVMVILGLLAALVGPNLVSQGGKARVKTARVQIANFSTALDAFALDTGRYPSSQQGLEALISAPSGVNMWDGPYMKKIPKDPWGNDYQYTGPGDGNDYVVMSYGADGRAGGEGDESDISSAD